MSSNVKSGVLTLLHTACGAGILAMPYAFKPFGVLPGLFMILFCGFCAMFGLLLQSFVARYVPERNASFFALTQVTNPKLSVLFDFAIAIKCFGVGVSYMIVVGDVMPQILSHFTDSKLLLSRDFNITLIMIFIVSPLCFLKNLNSLRYASIIAISSVVYLCFLVLFHFIFPNEEIHEIRGDISWGFPTDEINPLKTLPIFVFAYTCHHNMFSVINEQKDTSFNKTKYISIFSMVLAGCLYIVIGGAGYLTFGSVITGNIITQYSNSIATTVGRVAIVFLVMLAFPLQCHPARASINHILHYFNVIRQESPNQIDEQGNSESAVLMENEITPQPQLQANFEVPTDELIEEEFPEQQTSFQTIELDNYMFIIITIGILVFSYLIAISVESLAKVLAIVGATGSTSISFILPGFFGYQLIGSEYTSKLQKMPVETKLLKYASLTLTVWGIFVMTASLFAAIFFGATH